jgi:hypothetical protein
VVVSPDCFAPFAVALAEFEPVPDDEFEDPAPEGVASDVACPCDWAFCDVAARPPVPLPDEARSPVAPRPVDFDFFAEAEDGFFPALSGTVPSFVSAVGGAEFEEVSLFFEAPDGLEEATFWPEATPSEGDSSPTTAVPDGVSPLAFAACVAVPPVP